MNLQTLLRSLEQFASQHDLPIIGSKKGAVRGEYESETHDLGFDAVEKSERVG